MLHNCRRFYGACKEHLVTAQRCELLAFLASSIIELTILGRVNYGGADASIRMQKINEAVHRIAGHLQYLVDPVQPLSDSRTDALVEALGLLPATRLVHLLNLADRVRITSPDGRVDN